MKLNYILLLLLAVIINACGKSSTGTDPTPATKTELLAKTWRISEELLNGTPSVNNNSQYRITYRPDGTYTEIDAQGNSSTGTWEFTSNDSAILYNKGSSGERQERVTITATNLDRSYTTQNYKTGNVDVVLKMAPVQ